jgi:hypothetical protein
MSSLTPIRNPSADIIQGKIENEGEQLWIYYLKENQVLQLSFRDFHLFKIEEK